ncbi:transposase [Butyricicoccus sp. Marseille-Q5471]|uniref:transposase n=1 Tax=Butyricicoccus sp. Marseille-Q5471 TaxID=3039493 RepID=UPI0024BCDC94|nr:transposase [Butyricicoccus sp. Marseille-Q5471]
MLRIYLLQIWFNLSAPATEGAIYGSYSMRNLTDIDFMTETVPNKTTLCKFRHLPEKKSLNKLFSDAISRVMEIAGHMMKGGTIVDATIINAPGSTKNTEKARDPKMQDDAHLSAINYRIHCHPHSFPKVSDNAIDREQQIEHRKSAVRHVCMRQSLYACDSQAKAQKARQGITCAQIRKSDNSGHPNV